MSTAKPTGVADRTEAAILTRMIHPERADLPAEVAEAVLDLFSMDQSDSDRLHDLLVRNQDDALTAAEKDELEAYLRVSMMVDLMHAKARHSIRMHD